MKVLQVNCVYRKGSTGKIMYDIHSQLKNEGYESIVCYGRGSNASEKGVYKTCTELYAKMNKLMSMISGVMYGGCAFSTRNLISIIEKENPDIVHLHCLNGNFINVYKLIAYLKCSGIKTVLTLHAEFMYTANCGYALECERWKAGCGNCPRLKKETGSIIFDRTAESWIRMKKAFEGFEKDLVVVSVSPWLRDRAAMSPIMSSFKHEIVLNGLDTDVFRPYDTEELKKKHGITNEKIVFHATPKFDDDPENIKGGKYVIEVAEKLNNSNIRVFVAGDYKPNMSLPENITLLGRISDQSTLARYYSLADVTLLTSKKETFSMVVAESLCCGTPVVGFRAGAPEQIALAEYSYFTDDKDVDGLIQAMNKFFCQENDPDSISKEARKKYAKEIMLNNYLNVYRGLFNGQKMY